MRDEHPDPRHGVNPIYDAYHCLETHAENQSLNRALADIARDCASWRREAERRAGRMRRLTLLAGAGWAAFVIMLLARWY